MINTELYIILMSNIVVSVIACLPIGFACKTQKNLRPWIFPYIFLTIANICCIFQFDNSIIRIFTNIFFVLATVTLVTAILIEYYELFIKPTKQKLTMRDKLTAALAVSPIVIGMEIFMIIILLISIVMLFRIYLKTHSATRLFFLMTTISALICAIASIAQNFAIEGAYFFSCVMVLFFASLLLSTGFVAVIERKLENTNETLKKVISSASEASINVANIATELAASASEVNASSEEIASTVQEMNQETQTVVASTDDLHKVMLLIKSIADQTNLLALNASIEAGRAGEHGRGFAVVADEVRKLAEEAKKAVSKNNQKFDIIIQKIQNATASMEGISASTEEQTASMEEITSTANRLGTLAEQLKEKLLI